MFDASAERQPLTLVEVKIYFLELSALLDLLMSFVICQLLWLLTLAIFFQMLTAESATLNLWVTLAIEYYRQGRTKEFVEILDKSRTDANLNYAKSEEDQMRQLDTLAAYYVQGKYDSYPISKLLLK